MTMSSTLRTATAAAVLLSSMFQLSSATPVAEAAAAATSPIAMNAMTYVGCFKSAAAMVDQGAYMYQTSGWCQPICYGLNDAAMALTGGSHCYCGPTLPVKSDMVDDSFCDITCDGFGTENCGGDNYWSVYKTGLDNSVGYASGSGSGSAASSGASSKSHASSTIASSTTAAASTSTPAPVTSAASSTSASSTSTTNAPVVVTSEAPGTTVVVTLSATSAPSATSSPDSDNKKEHKSKSNTAGIAAGVVVGVVVLAAIAGGVFFYMRNRRRKQIEEEYSKRSQAQGPSMTGSRGMSVRSTNAGPDARLDPEAMVNRRLSDGSIADEQDYSRRILKVTNPDDGR